MKMPWSPATDGNWQQPRIFGDGDLEEDPSPKKKHFHRNAKGALLRAGQTRSSRIDTA
jgi:hypothetical protein